MRTISLPKQCSFLIIMLFTILMSASQLFAQNKLSYGDIIHLKNGWSNYSGGYLDTRGYQRDYAKTGNFLCVSTATSSNRGGGKSGTWKVLSATGKANGTPVLVNDEIYLLNQWNKNGGYLDTRGYQRDYAKTGNLLCVSTANSSNRGGGRSGTWKIISAKGKANGTPVTNNSEIHLLNAWNKYSGGYLDTRGYQRDYAKTGNHLCVSTATSSNRDNGSGTWKVEVISTSKNYLNAGQTLKNNEKIVSSNKKYMATMQKDGNFCVYHYNNKKQGAFIWGSYQTNVKYGLGSNYKLIMQTDGNLCIYDKKMAFKWGSYQVKKYGLTSSAKLVLTDAGKLNILNASNSVIWSN